MNVYYIAGYPVADELYHHGIKGQKWGIRRWQNEDGTLTEAGKLRYSNKNAIATDLNQMDRDRAFAVSNLTDAQKKYKREVSKVEKQSSDKSEDWIKKHKELISKYEKIMQSSEKQIQAIDKDTKNLINKALEQGMKVKAVNVYRNTVPTFNDLDYQKAIWGKGKVLLSGGDPSFFYDDYTPEIMGKHYNVYKPLFQNNRIKHSIDELYHYGIKGQRWGVRRYQNYDRTLTPAGKERYGSYKLTDPAKPSEKSKRESDYFESIKRATDKGDYSEYMKVQDLLYKKFNDGSNTASIGNIPKNDNAYKGLRELDKAYSKTRGLESGVRYNSKTKRLEVTDEKKQKAYKDAWDHYWKVRYDFAGKALKSIGYEDTREAREFMDEWFKLRT